jgi:hypothetical protein
MQEADIANLQTLLQFQDQVHYHDALTAEL